MAQNVEKDAPGEGGPSHVGTVVISDDSVKVANKDEDPPLINCTTGTFIGLFSFFNLMAAGIIGGSGFILYCLQLNMSTVWFNNVTIIMTCIGLPLRISIASWSDSMAETSWLYKFGGKRKPFLLLSLPMIVLALLCFTLLTKDIRESKLQAVYFIQQLFVTVAGAIQTTPTSSWFIEASKDAKDYSNAITIVSICGAISATGGAVVTTQSIGIIKLVSLVLTIAVPLFGSLILWIIPSTQRTKSPPLPPLVPSFRQCVRTKEFRMVFMNEALVQISSGGVGIMLQIIIYTCFNFATTEEVQTLVGPVYGAIAVAAIGGTLLANRLIAKGYEKLSIYRNCLLGHAICSVGMFCTLVPTLQRFGTVDTVTHKAQCMTFLLLMVAGSFFFVPVVFIQGIFTRDLINFDTFMNKVHRETTYQVSLQVPASLVSTIVANLFLGILETTGYKEKAHSNILADAYGWNNGTIIQMVLYLAIFGVILPLLSYIAIRPYPLTTPVANAIAKVVKTRDEANEKAATLESKSITNGLADQDAENMLHKASSADSLEVELPLPEEDQISMMLHLSALECERIAASPIGSNNTNEGLSTVSKQNLFSAAVLGPATMIVLLIGGLHQIADKLKFTQIIFTFFLTIGVYCAYEFARGQVFRKLRNMGAEKATAMATAQRDRNRNFQLSLEELLKKYDIDESKLNGDDEDEEQFGRMTMTPAKDNQPRKSIVIADDEETEDYPLSGYKRIWVVLAILFGAGVASILEDSL